MDVAKRRKKPGPAPRISRRDVVEAARRLQAESNLTMTAIGEELGISVGALYRYVPDKAGVLSLLTLEERDTVEPPDTSLSWREWLKAMIQADRDFWFSHPETQSVTGMAATATPPKRAIAEGMALLTRAGFTPLDALTALTTASQTAFGLSVLDRLRVDHYDPGVAAEVREVLDGFGVAEGWLAIRDEIIEVVLDGIASRLPTER